MLFVSCNFPKKQTMVDPERTAQTSSLFRVYAVRFANKAPFYFSRQKFYQVNENSRWIKMYHQNVFKAYFNVVVFWIWIISFIIWPDLLATTVIEETPRQRTTLDFSETMWCSLADHLSPRTPTEKGHSCITVLPAQGSLPLNQF